MSFDPPTLPPTQPDWNVFQIWWQQVVTALQSEFGALEAAQIAQDAAAAAQTAADDAATAAAAAASSATNAQTTANTISEADSLAKSWVVGATITASDAGTDADIAISGHTRKYPQPDGTTVDVAVTGATLHGKPYSTGEWVYYDDAARAGGAVSYQTTTTEPAQIGDRHVVGYVVTPAAAGAPSPGGTTRPPGSGTVNA